MKALLRIPVTNTAMLGKDCTFRVIVSRHSMGALSTACVRVPENNTIFLTAALFSLLYLYVLVRILSVNENAT
jgi:hypothetical protein